MNTIFSLPMDIYKNRRLVAKLAKNDFKTRYAGSYLGIVWAFIQPVITILVYWFVFSVGFRSGTGNLGFPFVLYLVAGIVPWFFFQDALIGGTNSLLEYNYLVKKVVFNISVLPVVKIISAMFVHAFFVLFTIILYAAYGKLLQCMCVHSGIGLILCNKCNRYFFQRSDPDHQYCAPGRGLADSDHVDR